MNRQPQDCTVTETGAVRGWQKGPTLPPPPHLLSSLHPSPPPLPCQSPCFSLPLPHPRPPSVLTSLSSSLIAPPPPPVQVSLQLDLIKNFNEFSGVFIDLDNLPDDVKLAVRGLFGIVRYISYLAFTRPIVTTLKSKAEMARRVYEACNPSLCVTVQQETITSALLRGLGTVSLISALCIMFARQLYLIFRPTSTPFEFIDVESFPRPVSESVKRTTPVTPDPRVAIDPRVSKELPTSNGHSSQSIVPEKVPPPETLYNPRWETVT